MRRLHLRSAAIVLAAAIGLGGCATYSPFGYGSGVSVGYGNSGYYDPYYGGYSAYGYSPYGYSPYGYSPYGYSPYSGWYNGYYYPGSGHYVYDRNHNKRVWSDTMRDFWTSRGAGINTGSSSTAGTAGTSGTVGTTSTARERQRVVRVERSERAPAERRGWIQRQRSESSSSEPVRTRRVVVNESASEKAD
jgi:hypothetical protein